MKNKLQNFWYYYKIPAIIILVIFAAGLYFFLTTRGSVPDDYHIAIVSSRGCSGEQLAKIKTALERAGQDQNGDGVTVVGIRVFHFAIGQDGQDMQEIAGLDADLVGKESGIFITEDPEAFEVSTNGIGKASDAVPVSKIPLLAGCGINDLYLLPRTDADDKYTLMLSALTE